MVIVIVMFCRGTLAIAQVKAEMHGALEEKENELQAARARCKILEMSGLYSTLFM